MKVASTIALLAGLWYFVSPWVYGVYAATNSWNNWIVGAVVVILAAIRLGSPMKTVSLSWINCALGIWAFISPWIYGYTLEHGRYVNSLCVGVIMFAAAMCSVTSTPHSHHTVATHS